MTPDPGVLDKKRRAAAHPDRPGARRAALRRSWLPVIDHARCEGKRDCIEVRPNDVFEVRRIDDADFAALGRMARWRVRAHRMTTAYAPNADDCRGCGLCIVACPEQAIELTRLL
ncbi:MAG: ferredoxin family protein [Acidimicrobiales bacterium]